MMIKFNCADAKNPIYCADFLSTKKKQLYLYPNIGDTNLVQSFIKNGVFVSLPKGTYASDRSTKGPEDVEIVLKKLKNMDMENRNERPSFDPSVRLVVFPLISGEIVSSKYSDETNVHTLLIVMPDPKDIDKADILYINPSLRKKEAMQANTSGSRCDEDFLKAVVDVYPKKNDVLRNSNFSVNDPLSSGPFIAELMLQSLLLYSPPPLSFSTENQQALLQEQHSHSEKYILDVLSFFKHHNNDTQSNLRKKHGNFFQAQQSLWKDAFNGFKTWENSPNNSINFGDRDSNSL